MRLKSLIPNIVSNLRYIGVISLLFAIAVLVLEVIIRRIYKSIFPIDDIGGICMYVVALAGTPYAFLEGRFLRVRVFIERLPHCIKPKLEFIHLAFALTFVSYLVVLWIKMMMWSWKVKDYFLSIKIPYWPLQFIGLISLILLAIVMFTFFFKKEMK